MFNVFFAISLLSPLGKGWGLSLNKLESLTPKDALCLAWLKVGQMVMEKKNFKFWQCIFATSLSSPLGKGRGPSFEKKLNPPHQRMLCAPLGSNWPNGSGGEDENVNSLQTDRQSTDKRLWYFRWAEKPYYTQK